MSQKIQIYIPTFISDAQYNPNRVLPRLYFYNGTLECEKWYINQKGSGSLGVNEFPYFDHYNVVTGSFPSTGSKSLLFNNETPVYGAQPDETIYTDYWSKYIGLLYSPKTRLVNGSAIIPLADYFKMELNDIVEFRGNYFHLRAINDYNLKTGECKIQLLGPIISDTLSSGVFGCGFTFEATNPTTTTTTTAGPTTTTTTATPTTTTSTTSTTTTAAPTTTTTTAAGTTTTTTTAPTTTTTTATPTTTTTTTTIAPTTTTTTILSGSYLVEFLTVAGGGGSGRNGGGGGAGGGLVSGSFTIAPTSIFQIIVGAGGSAGINNSLGTQGGESYITGSSIIYATASGGGYGGIGVTSLGNGGNGGSGGGAHRTNTSGSGIVGQGYDGGIGAALVNPYLDTSGGGGGGASQKGQDYTTYVVDGLTAAIGGNGGSGSQWLNGNYYAGGGAGGGISDATHYGIGGIGGGGSQGIAGTVNTGGGAGGGRGVTSSSGSNGGSGIVIIRYPGYQKGEGGLVTSSGGYTYHTFNSSGVYSSF